MSDEASEGDTGKSFIEWVVALGPSAPGGNHNVPLDAYTSLVSGDCRRVVEIGELAEEPYNRLLYVGVGNACLAAFHGETDRWKVAEQNLDLLTGQQTKTGCYGSTAYDLLKGLVEAHRDNPDREIVRSEGSSGSGCVLVKGIDPDHGTVGGGYEVTLIGSHFPERGLITITGVKRLNPDPVVSYESSGGGTRIVFTMPPVEDPGLGYIVVDGEDEYWNSAAEFQFEDDASPQPTESMPAETPPSTIESQAPSTDPSILEPTSSTPDPASS